MNSELKARIERADAKLARSKEWLERVSTSLNREIDRFGTYRQVVLKNTVGRFKKDLDALGKKLKGGAYAIPEGIETPEQRDYLTRVGCDCGQGYLFARPMPLAEYSLYVDAHAPKPDDGAKP